MKTALCIPTLNAGADAAILAAAIASQTLQPDTFLVIDSGSDDGTVETFRRAGARIHSINGREFNHGGTRQVGVDMVSDADLIIFLTQDAVPADQHAFERLNEGFNDPGVGVAFGRQLPRLGAGHTEAHARLFNYPDASRVTTFGDRAAMGIKTVFLSNSFAAYRRTDLLAVGGFPSHLIMGEDTYVAAKMLLAGSNVAYCAEATVFHSHDYSLMEEFRRYFASDGPAWPFERQALIKLRTIAGDGEFGRELVSLRDELLFHDARWDAVPVRAMRERQVRQLVQAGTFQAKLSPGALVDVEYLVQLLQLANGERHSSLRIPNTLAALDELRRLELLSAEAHSALRSAYQLFRRLIDALRLLRGGADDLTLPSQSSESFANLARHLGLDADQLMRQIDEQSAAVRTWTTRLGWPIVPA